MDAFFSKFWRRIHHFQVNLFSTMKLHQVRLTESQINTILECIQKHSTSVGYSVTTLYLYGSRTQLDKKGGDIDLWLVVDDRPKKIEQWQRTLRNELNLALQQKVDLKVTQDFKLISDRMTKAFYETIKDSMIALWKKTQS